MAIKLCVVSPELAKIISADLSVKSVEISDPKKPSGSGREQKKFRVVELENGCIYVPMDYFLSNFSDIPSTDEKLPPSNMFGCACASTWQECKISFNGNLSTVQKMDMPRIVNCINAHRTAILAPHCGYGKTIVGVYLASLIGLKTVVLCHRLSIIGQWKATFERFSEGINVVVLKGKTDTSQADVVIVNVTNVPKYPRETFASVGFLIADEAHVLCSEVYSKALLHFTPKYAVAMTATPYRSDGLDRVLSLHFGTEIISRKLFRPFSYFIYETKFVPRIESNIDGSLNWNLVLESQARNEKRNNFIVEILRMYSDRTFLVLCKRIEQIKILSEKLRNFNEDVDEYTGTDKYFRSSARVLLSTYSKSGVGFDHPSLDALLVASDVQELFIQYVGRVFRREETFPIIIDFEDKFGVLKKHLQSRESVYQNLGGVRRKI
jgi:superfamily II DNA or RNA helicase